MMKWYILLLATTFLLIFSLNSFGRATEEIGPLDDRSPAAGDQPGRPTGTAALLGHQSRVYSRWVNFNENFYYDADADAINELIRLFSALRIRDHEMWIKEGSPVTHSFAGKEFIFNVDFNFVGGSARYRMERDNHPDTFDPTLTLYVHPFYDRVLLSRLKLRENIILHNEIADFPKQSPATKPDRDIWFMKVLFDDGTPAKDFEHYISTWITYWEQGIETGIRLGEVDKDGFFRAAFSKAEMTALDTGKSWLTLTAGDAFTLFPKSHARISAEQLFLNVKLVVPVTIPKPPH